MSSSAVLSEHSNEDLWNGGVSPLKSSYGKLMMWYFLLSDAFSFSGFLVAYGFVRQKYIPYKWSGDNAIDTFLPSDNYWPIPEKVFNTMPFAHGVDAPLVFVGIMTFILILSSVTMVLAVDAGHRMDKKDVEKWMLWTIIGGVAFLGCQAWEWNHFIHGSESIVKILDPFTMSFAGDYAKIIDVDGLKSLLVNTGDKVQSMSVADAVKQGFLIMSPGQNISDLVVTGAELGWNEYGPAGFANLFFFITGFHGTHVFSGILINIIIFYNVSVGTYQRRGHYEMVEKVGLYWHFVDLVWIFVFTFFYLV
jgi:cytochrome c oxidase subunit 3